MIFDEQGFPTNDDPDTENIGAYGFVLAWLKLRQQPLIDLLLLHRYADMPDDSEYSLKLGLRRAPGYGDERHLLILPGAYKKICYAIRVWTHLQKNNGSEKSEISSVTKALTHC